MNATDKQVVFLVLPTSYSDSSISSLVLGVEVPGGGANVAVERDVVKEVLKAATNCQAFTVPPKKTTGADPTGGQRCPFKTCFLPRKGGSEARIALVTVDSQVVSVWLTQILPQRTRLVVLPRMFEGSPIGSRGLGTDPFSVVETAGLANHAPAATVGGAGGADEKE